jgi:hypothetical protein
MLTSGRMYPVRLGIGSRHGNTQPGTPHPACRRLPRGLGFRLPFAALGADGGSFAGWPHQYGWWLDKREGTLRRLIGE